MIAKHGRAAVRRDRGRARAPGLTGRFSSESAFSPPIGSRWEPDAGPCGYYIDFSMKADKPSWPPEWLAQQDEQLHVATVQWALGAWERYLAGEGEAWRVGAIAAAEHLMGTQTRGGTRDGAWLHRFPMPHTFRIDPPWTSGIAQGEAASLLVRIHLETGEERFAEAARRALRPMRTSTSSGGVLAEVNGLPFFEEYPTRPGSFVLNGAIFALWGFRDVASGLNDQEARDWYERGIEGLASILERYDTGRWSRYDLYPHPLTNVASSAYHLLHIRQLSVLGRLTRRPVFDQVRSRFDSYRSSRYCRVLALDRKVAFRLVTPRNRLLAHRLPWNTHVRRQTATRT